MAVKSASVNRASRNSSENDISASSVYASQEDCLKLPQSLIVRAPGLLPMLYTLADLGGRSRNIGTHSAGVAGSGIAPCAGYARSHLDRWPPICGVGPGNTVIAAGKETERRPGLLLSLSSARRIAESDFSASRKTDVAEWDLPRLWKFNSSWESKWSIGITTW